MIKWEILAYKFPLFETEEQRKEFWINRNEKIELICWNNNVPYLEKKLDEFKINNYIADFYYPIKYKNNINKEGWGWTKLYDYPTYPILLKDFIKLYEE